jgi:hypothetical protein
LSGATSRARRSAADVAIVGSGEAAADAPEGSFGDLRAVCPYKTPARFGIEIRGQLSPPQNASEVNVRRSRKKRQTSPIRCANPRFEAFFATARRGTVIIPSLSSFLGLFCARRGASGKEPPAPQRGANLVRRPDSARPPAGRRRRRRVTAKNGSVAYDVRDLFTARGDVSRLPTGGRPVTNARTRTKPYYLLYPPPLIETLIEKPRR